MLFAWLLSIVTTYIEVVDVAGTGSDCGDDAGQRIRCFSTSCEASNQHT